MGRAASLFEPDHGFRANHLCITDFQRYPLVEAVAQGQIYVMAKGAVQLPQAGACGQEMVGGARGKAFERLPYYAGIGILKTGSEAVDMGALVEVIQQSVKLGASSM